MGKIIVLDELTASQIAAGEVIERPASVVKETVENAIDAGATAITVEIRAGGIKYIRITDNGCGFEADDAVIAFDKHATSKIRSGSDLNNISTLGFRGEALASIAAVADVELLSRTESDSEGVYVHMRGGELLDHARRGSPKGTVLTVRDLFFNVPARYKFLKKDQTEAGYVAETLERLALSNPGVAFRLISNGQDVLRTPGGSLEAQVFSIFGKTVMQDLLPVAYTDGENSVSGYVGVRNNIFGTRARQYFFVNGRFVKSRVISSAVDESYKTVTMKHRFPMCILSLEVPVSRLDVNVHPAKTEVRFASEKSVFDTVYSGIRNALLYENRGSDTAAAAAPVIASGLGAGAKTVQNSASEGVSFVENHVENSGKLWKSPVIPPDNEQLTLETDTDRTAKPDVGPYGDGAAAAFGDAGSIVAEKHGGGPVDPRVRPPEIGRFEPQRVVGDPEIRGGGENVVANTETRHGAEGNPAGGPSTGANTLTTNADTDTDTVTAGTDTFTTATDTVTTDADTVTTDADTQTIDVNTATTGTYNETDVFTRGRIIGQYLKTYILLEIDGELAIIDQHAAHERIKYEAICSALDSADANRPVSPLLLPVQVELSAAEKLWLDANLEQFSAIGFEIDDFGPGTVLIRAIPTTLSEADPEDLLLGGIRAAMSAKGSAEEAFRLEAVDTMACKAAVKGNQKLTLQEIEGLLASLAKLKNSATCPHGRPIVIRITAHEMEKRFRRCL